MAIGTLLPYDWEIIGQFLMIATATAVGRFIFKSPLVTMCTPYYFAVPLFLLLEAEKTKDLIAASFDFDFTTLCAASASFAAASWIIYGTKVNEKYKSIKRWSLSLTSIFTGIFTMMLIWDICLNLFTSVNVAHSVAILIFVISAIFMIYLGQKKGVNSLRYGGIAIIVYVIYHLLTKESIQMPVEIRALTFVLVGLLLIGTTYLTKKQRIVN